MRSFSGSDIDLVLLAIKDAGIVVSVDYVSKSLIEINPKKIRDIFQYLYDNYRSEFELCSLSEYGGIMILYHSDMDKYLLNGGFSQSLNEEDRYKSMEQELMLLKLEKLDFEKKQREAASKVEGILKKANLAKPIIDTVLSIAGLKL